MKKWIFILCFSLFTIFSFSQSKPIVFNSTIKYDSVKDKEGNSYKTVRIGNQIWMAENLRSFFYRNGDIIKGEYTSIIEMMKNKSSDQKTEDLPYNPDEESAFQGEEEQLPPYLQPEYVNTYGVLYTYDEVMSEQGICPIGWHIPSMPEWNTLIQYLGGPDLAAVKLKETGTSHWMNISNATNSSGFTALPSGFINEDEVMQNRNTGITSVGYKTSWWSSEIKPSLIESESSNYAMAVHINNFNNKLYTRISTKFPVRCIKN
jgi:uncharacterized protein (TIGR02145 family)